MPAVQITKVRQTYKSEVELHSDIPLYHLEFSLLPQKTRMEQLERPK